MQWGSFDGHQHGILQTDESTSICYIECTSVVQTAAWNIVWDRAGLVEMYQRIPELSRWREEEGI
jgi:hypothetical protein